MTDTTPKIVALVANDGKMFPIPEHAAQGEFLDLLFQEAFEQDEHLLVVPLQNFGAWELERVVAFLMLYAQQEMIPIRDPRKELWHATFEANVPQQAYSDFLYGLGRQDYDRVRSVAYFLGIDPLVSLIHVWTFFR